MLGHSGAGKTTYLSLMYKTMQNGVSGFGLSSSNADDGRRLLANAQAILRNRYPDPSDMRAVYNFTLQYQGRDVYPFTWRDYRGAALAERSTSAQANELRADLAAADGMVLFIDAVDLVKSPRVGREVRALTQHVLRAIDARGGRKTPLVITLTKIDLLDVNDEVEQRLLAPFQELISAVAGTQHVLGTLVPVACGPSPENVIYPLLWSLYFGVLSRAEQLHRNYEAKLAESRRQAGNDWFGDRIWSAVKGEPSWYELSQRSLGEAKAALDRLQPLIQPIEALHGAIEDLPYCF
jgi:hypothetical protein